MEFTPLEGTDIWFRAIKYRLSSFSLYSLLLIICGENILFIPLASLSIKLDFNNLELFLSN